MKRYIVLGFDMETDIGSYLKSYRGVINGTPHILNILRHYGIQATFFFTGDAAEKNPEAVRMVAKAEHEIGCHSLRHETVGDAHFNMPNDSPILEDEVEPRLELNKQMVQALAGTLPVSFRAPRLWQGAAQIRALERLGFLVDASYSVAAHKTMTIPYHPSRDNWLEPGDLRLLEIPNFAFHGDNGRFRRFFGKNDQWPLLRLLGARFVLRNLKAVVEEQLTKAESPCLLFYLHPWEFERMPATYHYDEGTFHFKPELHKNCGPAMIREFTRFVESALSDGYEFVSCDSYRRIHEQVSS